MLEDVWTVVWAVGPAGVGGQTDLRLAVRPTEAWRSDQPHVAVWSAENEIMNFFWNRPKITCVGSSGAIGVDMDGYHSSCIAFCIFFSELESDTNNIGYPFQHPIFALWAFGRSVRQKLSASFAPIHRTLGSRSAIRVNTKRLIAKMSKEKTLSMLYLLRCNNHLSIIMFLSEVTTGFPHTTWDTDTYGWISLIPYPIPYFFLRVRVKHE